MANIDAPRGLRPIRGEYNSAPKLETFLSKDGDIVGEGQIVCIAATGRVISYTSALGVAGNVIGVAAHYVAAASTATGPVTRELQVYTDPNQLYEIQADDATITNIAACIGAFFSVVNPVAQNVTLETSLMELNGSSAAANVGTGADTITPLRVDSVGKNIQNELLAAGTSWTKFNVRIASQVHHRGTAMVIAATQTIQQGI